MCSKTMLENLAPWRKKSRTLWNRFIRQRLRHHQATIAHSGGTGPFLLPSLPWCLLRESCWLVPSLETLGSHHRSQGLFQIQEGMPDSPVTSGAKGGFRICRWTACQRVYLLIQIWADQPSIFHAQKGWLKTDGSRLLLSKQTYHMEQLSALHHLPTHQQTQGLPIFHKDWSSVGLQQHTHQRRRQMESCLHLPPWIFQANNNVLWIMQFPFHFPDNDE